MQKLHYVPNLLARSFRAGADPAVGLAVPDIGDPFFAAIPAASRSTWSARHGGRGHSLGARPAERERSALEALLRRGISGLIVGCASADQAYLAAWEAGTPIVFVDRAPRDSPACT